MKSRAFSTSAVAAISSGLVCTIILTVMAAQAQLHLKPPQLTGNLAKDTAANFGIKPPASTTAETPDELWRQIQSVSAADLKYAKALADNVASPGSRLRSACYGAWVATIEQSQGVGLKAANGDTLAQPDPHVFSSFEQLAEIADNLQPTGSLMSACAPAWTALKLSATQFFATVVGGVAGLSALGITIP
jgi:hypothetical protein